VAVVADPELREGLVPLNLCIQASNCLAAAKLAEGIGVLRFFHSGEKQLC
jgi:hypothetical protein